MTPEQIEWGIAALLIIAFIIAVKTDWKAIERELEDEQYDEHNSNEI